MSNKKIRCNDCGLEYTDISNAMVCCDSDGVIAYKEDEPDTNELGQEEWEVNNSSLRCGDELRTSASPDRNAKGDASEFVEEQLYEAEDHIERALRACESRDQRGELTGLHRRIIGIQFRYYDIVHEQNNE